MRTPLAASLTGLLLLIAAPAVAQTWSEVGLTVTPAKAGLEVTGVQPGGFANAANLEVGDVIYSVVSPRQRITTLADLKGLADTSPGIVRLTVRKSTSSLATVVVQVPASIVPPTVVSYPSLGVVGLKIADGCKVNSPVTGKAQQLGIAAGDVIAQVNGVDINTLTDVAALTTGDFSLTVLVGGDRALAVTLEFKTAAPPPLPTWEVVVDNWHTAEGVVWVLDHVTGTFENPPRAYLQPSNGIIPTSTKIYVKEGDKVVVVPRQGDSPRADMVVDRSMQVVAGVRRIVYPEATPPVITPPNIGGNDTRYDVDIYTFRMLQSPGLFDGRSAFGDGPGTDASVYVTIVGDQGTVALGPYSGAGPAFEKMRQDSFTSNLGDVGNMREIHIRHDATNLLPDWNLGRVTITKTRGNYQETATAYGPTWLIGSDWLKFTLH